MTKNYLTKQDIENLRKIKDDNCLLMNGCDYEANSLEELEEEIRQINEQRAIDGDEYLTIDDISLNDIDNDYCFSFSLVSQLEQEGFRHYKATLEELEDESNTLNYLQSSHHFI